MTHLNRSLQTFLTPELHAACCLLPPTQKEVPCLQNQLPGAFLSLQQKVWPQRVILAAAHMTQMQAGVAKTGCMSRQELHRYQFRRLNSPARMLELLAFV